MKPQGRILGAVVLAALQAGWSTFQWRELLDLRQGGEAFCFGGGGGCALLWDSPLASAVHASTGLPVAAWGLVWGIAAAALPLWA